MRLASDGELWRRYGRPLGNPWPKGTLAHEQAEARNAFRALAYLLLRDFARVLRRLPFFD